MYITYKKPCYFHQIPNWKVRTLGLFPLLRCWGSPLPPVCITPGNSAPPPALQNAKSCTKLPGQLEEHCRVIRVTPSMPPEPLLPPAGGPGMLARLQPAAGCTGTSVVSHHFVTQENGHQENCTSNFRTWKHLHFRTFHVLKFEEQFSWCPC